MLTMTMALMWRWFRAHRRQAGLALALLLTLSQVAAAFDLFGLSRSADQFPTGRLPRARVDATVRAAAPGTENLLALFGGSPDGSREERYARNFHDQVGGTYLHGDYDLDDLVGAMLPADRAERPLANVYLVGHINGRDPAKFPDWRAAHPDEEVMGVLETGRDDDARILNANNQFFSRYDARMRELGVTPDQVYAPGAQIIFKNCFAGSMTRDFLEQYADRLPQGTSIEAYASTYNWNEFTQYPLGIRTEGVHNMGMQEQGLVLIPGRWTPPAATAEREPAPATAEPPVTELIGEEPAEEPYPAPAAEPTAEPPADIEVGDDEQAVDLGD